MKKEEVIRKYGVVMPRVNRKQCRLDGIDLRDWMLVGAKYKGIWLDRPNFAGLSLKEIELEEACVELGIFKSADMSLANLKCAYMRICDFRFAKLEGANMMQGSFYGSNFVGADMRGSLLSATNLKFANLQGVDLRGANLHRADLRWANLRGAILRNEDVLKTAFTTGLIR